jgi:hypothetical protein
LAYSKKALDAFAFNSAILGQGVVARIDPRHLPTAGTHTLMVSARDHKNVSRATFIAKDFAVAGTKERAFEEDIGQQGALRPYTSKNVFLHGDIEVLDLSKVDSQQTLDFVTGKPQAQDPPEPGLEHEDPIGFLISLLMEGPQGAALHTVVDWILDGLVGIVTIEDAGPQQQPADSASSQPNTNPSGGTITDGGTSTDVSVPSVASSTPNTPDPQDSPATNNDDDDNSDDD